MHGEHGAFRAAPPPGQGTRLSSGQSARLTNATMGPDLLVQIALVPAEKLPTTLPPGVIASDPFLVPGAGLLQVELRQGSLASGQRTTVPADEAPALLLVSDGSLQVEHTHDAPGNLPRGAMTLLTATTTIRNPGPRTATFIATWMSPQATDPAQAAALHGPGQGKQDAEINEAWRRNGCPLNPGNPSCLTVGLAAACAVNLTATGCDVDSDADTCRDVAEVRAGLDPFDPADCLGDRDGRPLLNCLFVAGNLSCNGRREAGEEPAAELDCSFLDRNPACDGFAPTTARNGFVSGGIIVATRR